MSNRPLCLLSLDGGGIRGLSELLIVEEIMERVKKDLKLSEDPLPAEFFDMIAGTSTGGLNALLLGRLRLSVPQARKVYVAIAKEVFSKPRRLSTTKFDGEKLEQQVKNILRDKYGKDHAEDRMLDESGNSCKTFVCAVPNKDVSARAGPRLFRSYTVRENESFNCTIWEASRATSAAPTYFPPINIGPEGEEETFVDGAMGYNNPIEQILEEAQRVFPAGRNVACIVSIGTGLAKTLEWPSRLSLANLGQIANTAKGIITDAEATAERIQKKFLKIADVYFRFNVDRGLSSVALDEWNKLSDVRNYTTEYTRLATISSQIDQVVEVLLRRKMHVMDDGSTYQVSTRVLPSAPGSLTVQEITRTITWHPARPNAPDRTQVPVENLVAINAERLDPPISVQQDKDDGLLMQSLYEGTTNYLAGKALITKSTDGTGSWFLERFEQWRDSPQSSLLLITGNPGCGKSVLSSMVVDELGKPSRSNADTDAKPSRIVCYFFINASDTTRNSAAALLCGLLHQLFSANSALIQCARSIFRQKGRKFTEEVEAMWEILVTAAKKHKHEITCIVDGLDECGSGVKLLIECLVKHFSLINAGETNPILKFAITSRPYYWITSSFRGFSPVEITAGLIKDDIETVIKRRVHDIFLEIEDHDNLSGRLVQRLVDNAHGTFLWVDLVLRMVEHSYTQSGQMIMDLLKELPPDLDSTYEKILQRCDSKRARPILLIVMAAVRPLTLAELRAALLIQTNKRPMENTQKYVNKIPDIKDYVTQLTGFFLRVDLDSRVHPIHETAREFLMKASDDISHLENPQSARTEGLIMPANEAPRITKAWKWKQSLDLVEANAILAKKSVFYLSYFNGSDEISGQVSQAADFLVYSSAYWATHFRAIQNIKGNEALTSHALKICNTECAIFSVWFREFWNAQERMLESTLPKHWTNLMVASYLGLTTVVDLMLKMEKGNVLSSGDVGETALHLASRMGYDDVVHSLLKNGAQVNAKDEFGHTSLHAAVRKDHPTIVKQLLLHGAEVDSMGVDRGHLQHKTDTNVNSFTYFVGRSANETALQWAASRGLKEIVELLLQRSGSTLVNTGITGHSSVLYYDSMRVNSGTFSLYLQSELTCIQIQEFALLRSQALIELEDGLSASNMAAQNGHDEIVAILNEASAKAKKDIGADPSLSLLRPMLTWLQQQFMYMFIRSLEHKRDTAPIQSLPRVKIGSLSIHKGIFLVMLRSSMPAVSLEKLQIAQRAVKFNRGGGPDAGVADISIGEADISEGNFVLKITAPGMNMEIEKFRLSQGNIVIAYGPKTCVTQLTKFRLGEVWISNGDFGLGMTEHGLSMEVGKLTVAYGNVYLTLMLDHYTGQQSTKIYLGEVVISNGDFGLAVAKPGLSMEVGKLVVSHGNVRFGSSTDHYVEQLAGVNQFSRIYIRELEVCDGNLDLRMSRNLQIRIGKLKIYRGCIKTLAIGSSDGLRGVDSSQSWLPAEILNSSCEEETSYSTACLQIESFEIIQGGWVMGSGERLQEPDCQPVPVIVPLSDENSHASMRIEEEKATIQVEKVPSGSVWGFLSMVLMLAVCSRRFGE